MPSDNQQETNGKEDEPKKGTDPKELYFEYKLLSEQLKKLEAYLQQSTGSLEQVAGTREALQQFSRQEKGSRLFAPIANGIFLDVTLNDPTSVRMNVGKGVVATKSIDEANALLEKQEEELRRLRDHAHADILELTKRLKEIEAVIEAEDA